MTASCGRVHHARHDVRVELHLDADRRHPLQQAGRAPRPLAIRRHLLRHRLEHILTAHVPILTLRGPRARRRRGTSTPRQAIAATGITQRTLPHLRQLAALLALEDLGLRDLVLLLEQGRSKYHRLQLHEGH